MGASPAPTLAVHRGGQSCRDPTTSTNCRRTCRCPWTMARAPTSRPCAAIDSAAVHRRADGRPRGPPGRTVVYAFPRTGRPDQEIPKGWDQIPGARGCTPESCGFRDLYATFRTLGAAVYGLSTQTTEYQQEAVARLGLPFELLSDERLALTNALQAADLRRRVDDSHQAADAGGKRRPHREGLLPHLFHPTPTRRKSSAGSRRPRRPAARAPGLPRRYAEHPRRAAA